MVRSTVVGLRKGSEIDVCPSECVWACWAVYVVCGVWCVVSVVVDYTVKNPSKDFYTFLVVDVYTLQAALPLPSTSMVGVVNGGCSLTLSTSIIAALFNTPLIRAFN